MPQVVDENSTTSLGLGTSSNDVEFEAGVKHFMTLNNSLKQIGTKAQALIQSIRSQGQVRDSSRTFLCALMFSFTTVKHLALARGWC